MYIQLAEKEVHWMCSLDVHLIRFARQTSTFKMGRRSKLECRRTDTALRSELSAAPASGRKNLATIFQRAFALALTGSICFFGGGPVA